MGMERSKSVALVVTMFRRAAREYAATYEICSLRDILLTDVPDGASGEPFVCVCAWGRRRRGWGGGDECVNVCVPSVCAW
jgi:hypothetical protein